MNDVRDAIERVGGRFDPEAGFEDLARRGRRATVQRRVAAGAVALMVAAGGSLVAVRAFSNVSPAPAAKVRVAITWLTTSSATPTASSPVAASCPTPSGDSPPPVALSPTSGPAGSSVEVSGTFETGEDWLQLWWNADGDTLPSTLAPPPWPATGPDLTFDPVSQGPVTELASVASPAETGDCSFRTEVTVPDVPAGSYQMVAVFGGADAPPGEAGYIWLLGPFTFEVTE
jgi:hypothetical protein